MDRKVYGVNANGAFPLSQYVLSGDYTSQDLIDPSPLDATLFQQGQAGVSWPQVNQIVFFAEGDNWVVASVSFPNAPAASVTSINSVTVSAVSSSTKSVQPTTNPVTKAAQSTSAPVPGNKVTSGAATEWIAISAIIFVTMIALKL